MKPQHGIERIQRMFKEEAEAWRGSNDATKENFVEIYDSLISGYESLKGINNQFLSTAWDDYVFKREDYLEEILRWTKDEAKFDCNHESYEYKMEYLGVGYEFVKICTCNDCGKEWGEGC